MTAAASYGYKLQGTTFQHREQAWWKLPRQGRRGPCDHPQDRSVWLPFVICSRFASSAFLPPLLLLQTSCFASLRHTITFAAFLLCHHSTESSSRHSSASRPAHLFLEPPHPPGKLGSALTTKARYAFLTPLQLGRDYDAYGACSLFARSSIDFATRRIFYPKKYERCTKEAAPPTLVLCRFASHPKKIPPNTSLNIVHDTPPSCSSVHLASSPSRTPSWRCSLSSSSA